MSRIGKLPIEIPSGVTVEIKGNTVHVKGSLGEEAIQFDPNHIEVKQEDNAVVVTKKSEERKPRELHGLTRTLIANAVEGVSKGFEKRLEINGVGYRAKVSGDKKLELTLGFSHPVHVEAPEGVSFAMDEQAKNIIIVKGPSKQKVGQVAANIREYRKPEPYKGKGIKYIDEHIIRKVGKAAAKEA